MRAIHPGPSVIVEMKEKEGQHRVEMKFQLGMLLVSVTKMKNFRIGNLFCT